MPGFGLILPIQRAGAGLDTLVAELREEVLAAERAGFDAFFLTEFHQARGGALVSPLLVAAWLVAGTTRIRAGTMVLAAPLHDPVRLAEDALMLDWMTRGRVVLGLGAGHQAEDFALFEKPHSRRAAMLDELLDVLTASWSGEPFEHEGAFFQRSGHVTPPPYSTPHPPVWLGAHRPRGLRRAAERGDAWVCDPQRDVETVARLADVYRDAAAAADRPARVALFREAWIADSREQAEEEWAAHALAVHRLYYNVGTYLPDLEPWVGEVAQRSAFTFDRLAPGRFLVGGPDEVRTEAERWLELTGADYMAVRMRFPGGPSHKQTLAAIERFGAEVIAPLSR